MRILFVLFIYIVSCHQIHSQNTEQELAILLHDNLCAHNYHEAWKITNQLRRKVALSLALSGSSLYQEYYYLCLENSQIKAGEDFDLFANMIDSIYSENPQKAVKQLTQMTTFFISINDGIKAEQIYKHLINYPDYITKNKLTDLLYDIAWAYNFSQNPYRAYLLFNKCAESYKELDGKLGEYGLSLNGIAYESRYLGKKSLKQHITIGEIFEKAYGKDSKLYAINRDNLGTAYLEEENKPDSALKYFLQAYNLLTQMKDSTEDMIIVLNNLGNCYSYKGDKKKQKDYLEKAIIYNSGDTNSFVLYQNLISLYLKEGDLKRCAEYIGKISDNMKDNNCADVMADYYAALGDYDKFLEYERKFINHMNTVKSNNLHKMISNDRTEYLVQKRNCSIDSLFRISNRLNSQKFAELCYDYLLGEKSLSLSVDRNIEEIIHNSSDTRLKDAYSEFCALKPVKNDKETFLQRYKQLESVILDKLEGIGSITDFLNMTNRDVSMEMRDKDLAIEFYIADEHDDNRVYAIVLQSNGKVNVANLCNKDNKDQLKHLWGKLSPFLKNIKNIYFAPDGLLNMLPLESYMSPDGIRCMSDAFNMFRLTSTREIALNKRHKTIGKNAIIYGGLNYDDEQKRQKNIANSTSNSTRGAIIDLQYLEGSYKEAKNITEFINNMNKDLLSAKMITGKSGTESSFKSLSGKKLRIIHVATHGFFNQGTTNIIQQYNYEDWNLSNCGLFFAGANNRKDGFVSSNNDDGILTAYEISMLDLQGLDLVILSACDSGQGEITGDGVFGLQRGFKKAGAQSLLLSLWKVDDEATCLLMTEFYRNWIGEKKTKREALEIAKQAVRSHKEKGWDDPKYWAAFILLDALD